MNLRERGCEVELEEKKKNTHLFNQVKHRNRGAIVVVLTISSYHEGEKFGSSMRPGSMPQEMYPITSPVIADKT